MPFDPPLLLPAWPAPPEVGAAMSTRRGGVSQPPFDSLNLRPSALPAATATDAPAAVAENQHRFAQALGALPVWLDQVHGTGVLRLHGAADARHLARADASVTTVPGIACTVLVADCLPVLLCSQDGAAVAAAHAGWRGLAAGVLEATVAALCEAARCAPQQLMAWLGPCIGPRRFEVGADVLEAFPRDSIGFTSRPRPDGAQRWLADLPELARCALQRAGVQRVSASGLCTVEQPSEFFSFRRDGLTGRMAAAIWRRG